MIFVAGTPMTVAALEGRYVFSKRDFACTGPTPAVPCCPTVDYHN